jgi:hypothetical protein
LELLDFKENLSLAQNKIGSLEKQSQVEKKEITSLKQCMLEKDSALSKLIVEAKAELLSSTKSLNEVQHKYENQQQIVDRLNVFILINHRMIITLRI